MIKYLTLKTLQKAINHALSLDAGAQVKLNALNGKTLEVIITPLKVRFFIHFSRGKLRLYTEYTGTVDTLIESSPVGLIRLSLLPGSKVRSLFNDDIKLSGDVTLGQEVKRLFDELDIDWEGHLAQFTGDVVAYQIGSFVREGLRFKQQAATSIKQSMTEFLQEEVQWLPPREEIEDFFTEVDELSLTVERLEAHIHHLKRHETN